MQYNRQKLGLEKAVRLHVAEVSIVGTILTILRRLVHCALGLTAQCIVMGPVCAWWRVFVVLLPR